MFPVHQEEILKNIRAREWTFAGKFLPANASMVLSYSLMDEEQNAAFLALMTKVEDKNKASKTVSESFAGALGQFNLDYDKDLAPAFGDKFRLVYETLPGTTTGSGSTVDAYTM